ncbi:septum formation family protein [Nocardioides alkalitolerans]|uniref:septum formation family protein n=1 Tax=Nocardioides alkalitolerans TaxID=281714 RepID=UPI0003F983C0|nr:septum formation family protein [Nocardioides alkalitolerans]
MKKTAFARVATAGLALTVAAVLGGCGSDDEAQRDDTSGEITSSGEADVFTLEVGDCLLDTDSEQLTDVPAVPCTEAHDTEVFHSFEMPDGDWPGDDAIDTAAQEECLPAFEEFVGLAYEESTLEVGPITPTQDGWEELDDHEVLCLVYDPAGQTEGSLAGAAI